MVKTATTAPRRSRAAGWEQRPVSEDEVL